MTIDVTHRDDLREVYLYVYDAFATSVSEVASLHPAWNTRYARELLATLQQGEHVVLTEDGEGSEAWQTFPDSYDTMTREEAEAKIDAWLGLQPVSVEGTERLNKARPARAKTAEPHDCLCGCGEVITSKALYRPGHDARHAGIVGREIAAIMEGGHDEGQDAEISALYNTLPTAALIGKAKRVADNANRKNLAKAQPEPREVQGIVKVGKTERVARRYPNGLVEYMLDNGEYKTASKAATATFQEG